jgi:biotin-[acetyl-CoA-carboxylase] ligase BirA-like protein
MKQEILDCLNTKWIGRDLHYYASTGSTNQDAMRLLEDGAKEGVLVVAGAQDFGKGRRGRVWQSPPDVNVYMTLGLCPDYAPDLAPMTTLIMAMAVVRAIEDCCKLQCQIKWPNDVVINGKKICGILTEMSLTAEKAPHVVIGVGINVNTGTELMKGRATVVSPAVNITLLGMRLGKGRWYGALEMGAMAALNNAHEVYMFGSRIFTASVGVRL